MKNVLFVISLLFLFNWARSKYWPSYQALSKQTLSSLESCRNKKMCAVIYIAPWCPACESALPIIKNYIKNAKSNMSYGIQIVVGDEQTKGENDAKAKEIGENAIADNNLEISKSLNIKAYPTYFVLKDGHKIVMQGEEASLWLSSNFSQ